jgi:hypothetical protein
MITYSACEYIMFTPAQLLRNRLEQWPSNQGDLDSEAGRVLHRSGPASDFLFVPKYVIVVGLHFKWYTVYLIYTWNCLHCIIATPNLWGGNKRLFLHHIIACPMLWEDGLSLFTLQSPFRTDRWIDPMLKIAFA